MNKDKQIEEMARILCGQVKSCTECTVHKPCLMMNCATILTEKGYRKAFEVAKEIFEEIEKLMNEVYSSVQYGCYSYGTTKDCDSPSAIRQCGKLEGVKYLGDKIAELKKKYTEGEE